MFTDAWLQTIATESCARSSQYDRESRFYVGEFPAVLAALGMEDPSAVKTVEADTNWELLALVDATRTACGTEVARILSAH